MHGLARFRCKSVDFQEGGVRSVAQGCRGEEGRVGWGSVGAQHATPCAVRRIGE